MTSPIVWIALSVSILLIIMLVAWRCDCLGHKDPVDIYDEEAQRSRRTPLLSTAEKESPVEKQRVQSPFQFWQGLERDSRPEVVVRPTKQPTKPSAALEKWKNLAALEAWKKVMPAKAKEEAALEAWKRTAAEAKAKEQAALKALPIKAKEAAAAELEQWKREAAAAKAKEQAELQAWKSKAAAAKAEEEAELQAWKSKAAAAKDQQQ